MTPTQAASTAKHGRRLMRRGDITPRDFGLLDCLLWSCRQPGTRFARVTYDRLQMLARLGREGIAAGLRRLEAAKLLTRHRQRSGARVAANVYELHAAPDRPDSSEFGQPTAICVQAIKEDAREALTAALRASEARFAAAWANRRRQTN